MEQEISKLIEISKFYGQKKEYVIAGGGNTSYKDDSHLWIKASGTTLANITENNFCILDRKKLNKISEKQFSSKPELREEEVKNALLESRINTNSGLRPSVETSLHNLFKYSYVVHTHPTLINSLMCCKNAKEKTYDLFGEKVLFVPYSDPGYILFKIIEEKIQKYKTKNNSTPQIVFIQNHGIFVAANTTEEIKNLYSNIEKKIKNTFHIYPELKELTVSKKMLTLLPAIRMLISKDTVKTATAFNSNFISHFITDKQTFTKGISRPFNPDQLVYCLSEYLYIENNGTTEEIIKKAHSDIINFRKRKGTMPKIIFIQNEGAIACDDSANTTSYLKAMVNDFCQISLLSENFGGPHPLTKEQVAFLENWEVENYRKKVASGKKTKDKLNNKIIIITGAAQGFGAGIAQNLFHHGANIIIADLNKGKGEILAKQLNQTGRKNQAKFILTDVSDANSVEEMIQSTTLYFGGIDIIISNAGILHAGSLDEMSPSTFDLMTKVNYTGYFLCSKYAQKVMKIQHRYKPNYFMDIIQINSKSGLKGSNKNFAYAGGKFGGIGLTQSFALELMPYNIKVNSICPGNYFDGPLWSDPEHGLFVQYLKTGKVSGAKTINDVKNFYEAKIPAGRGCTPTDVTKAILYVIDQEYETGQAIPVTGGQNMLK